MKEWGCIIKGSRGILYLPSRRGLHQGHSKEKDWTGKRTIWNLLTKGKGEEKTKKKRWSGRQKEVKDDGPGGDGIARN